MENENNGMESSPRPKARPHKGISKETEKSIEDALSEAQTDDVDNPTSRYNRLKGRNNPARYGRKDRDEVQRFAEGGEVRPGDVRDNPKRGKCY